MARHSTTNRPRPSKPWADFPLFPHATGRWAKKVRGKLRYFGKVADDPHGEKALDLWLAQKDALLAGRVPRSTADAGVTIRDLCNAFMTHKQSLLTAGEITEWTFKEYYGTCERLCRVLGRDRPVDDTVSADFQSLRDDIARTWGPVRLANEIGRVRGVFKFGYESAMLDKPPRFGPAFKKPSAKVLRKSRAAAGLRMFERDELRALLAVCPLIQKAMVLLAVNGGLGNHDIATLPTSAVNLKTGWLTYARPKTGIDRRFPLWPESIDAVSAVLRGRQSPKSRAHEGLLFISPEGESYISNGSGHRIAKAVLYYIEKAKIRRPGLTFYSLRRTFQTIAEGARDLSAVQAIMGHAPTAGDMSAVYRQRVDDARLLAVVNYVRKWLFAEGQTE
jgi:integrase